MWSGFSDAPKRTLLRGREQPLFARGPKRGQLTFAGSECFESVQSRGIPGNAAHAFLGRKTLGAGQVFGKVFSCWFPISTLGLVENAPEQGRRVFVCTTGLRMDGALLETSRGNLLQRRKDGRGGKSRILVVRWPSTLVAPFKRLRGVVPEALEVDPQNSQS